MDIRYFAFLDRLKQMRDDEEDARVRGETVSQRAFNPHIGGSNPSGRTKGSGLGFVDAGLLLWLESEDKEGV